MRHDAVAVRMRYLPSEQDDVGLIPAGTSTISNKIKMMSVLSNEKGYQVSNLEGGGSNPLTPANTRYHVFTDQRKGINFTVHLQFSYFRKARMLIVDKKIIGVMIITLISVQGLYSC